MTAAVPPRLRLAAVAALPLLAIVAFARDGEAPGAPAPTDVLTPDATPFADAIRIARERVVKVYGATVGMEKGYASGVVVAEGRVVTALAGLLESERLRVVFADGRRSPARVIARDARRRLALLQTDVTDAPHFEIGASTELIPGDWVIAATNCFSIAAGDEPVTTAVGVLSARGVLEARQRTRDFSYDGPVLFTDVVVSSPGSAGGALVDARGRLVGVIGRPVQSTRTNTWANYALPVEEVAAFLAAPADAGAPAPADEPPAAEVARADLGIRLFTVGGRTKPAFIERVRRDSPAAAAGLRINDLVVGVNGRAVGTCEQFDAAMKGVRAGDPVELSVKRGEEILTVTLTAGAAP
ncbi:MAG: serine protease [Phycisphaerales bacterium]|nr:serine protease [Phycisphaerales bacterium]